LCRSSHKKSRNDRPPFAENHNEGRPITPPDKRDIIKHNDNRTEIRPMDKNMTLQKCRAAITRLERRVGDTIEQCRRFEEMTEPLELWARKWSTATLERWLHLDHLPLIEREKALVGLALKATDEAGAVLDAYDPTGEGQDHELFWQVARIEWEQRYQTHERRLAA
jgi:hypothetical protein